MGLVRHPLSTKAGIITKPTICEEQTDTHDKRDKRLEGAQAESGG